VTNPTKNFYLAKKNIPILRLKYLIERFFYTLSNYGILATLKKIYKTCFYSNKIDLDKLNIPNNLGLDDLFLKFGTDKGSLDGKKTYDFLEKNRDGEKKFKNYYEWINRNNPRNFEYQFGLNFTPYYEKYLGPLRDKSLKILEIGVANGHSVASWFYYFPNSEIYAVDIKKKHKFWYKGKRINYHSLDCLDDEAVRKFITKNNNFDIIIDDSFHEQSAHTNNIKNFYPTLNPGGIYVLEDFNTADHILKMERKYNEDSGKRLMHRWSILTSEIFDYIKNKKMFKHEIFKEDDLKYIFDTIDRVEVHNLELEHPWAALGFLFKKKN